MEPNIPTAKRRSWGLERPPSRASMAADAAANINVIARFRPLVGAELESPIAAFVTSDTTCHVQSDELQMTFTFDRVFGTNSTQEDVFNFSLRQTVDDVLNGYNGTVLAYGQTGAGKSYTMMGSQTGEFRGAIPRIVEAIFGGAAERPQVEFSFLASYMEIYNERVRDLLDPTKDNLPVHESQDTSGFYVKGVTQMSVQSIDEIYKLLRRGAINRSVAATNANTESSRSHSIFSLQVEQKVVATTERRRGLLCLVDLAGSEMVRKSGASGQLLEEAKAINKSLSGLGMVIKALSDPKVNHIPYRDSKLTRLLQESLGGNARTSLIINCSPSALHVQETLSTLRFGMRAKEVKNNAHINSDPLRGVSLRQHCELLQNELLQWRLGRPPCETDWVDLAPLALAPMVIAPASPAPSRVAPASVIVARRVSSGKSKDLVIETLKARLAEVETNLAIVSGEAARDAAQSAERIAQLEEQLRQARGLSEQDRRDNYTKMARHNMMLLSEQNRTLKQQVSRYRRSLRMLQDELRVKTEQIGQLRRHVDEKASAVEASSFEFNRVLAALSPRVMRLPGALAAELRVFPNS